MEKSSPLTIREQIIAHLEEGIQVKQKALEEGVPVLVEIAGVLSEALEHGHKILIFGNGGSAADSQHIATELVSRFRINRVALPAIALTTDTSALTAIGNDFSFSEVFSRQVEALGQAGDVAWGISTSGNSENVLKALEVAKQRGLVTVGFTGQNGGKLKDLADYTFCVPSQDTARIQEVHISAAHALCDVIESQVVKG